MTWRGWLLPGALFAVSAAAFGVSWLLWRAARIEERTEEQVGA